MIYEKNDKIKEDIIFHLYYFKNKFNIVEKFESNSIIRKKRKLNF